MPENFFKTAILRKKRILRSKTYDLVIIGQFFLPIIGEIGTKIKESAQVLTKLDFWFLTVSRLRGTHLGTLSDFVRLLSTKNGSLEKQKI